MCKKLAITLVLAVALSASSAAAEETAAEEYPVIQENVRGTYQDFDVEFWKDKGSASMTLTGGGTFLCEWDRDKTGNILFRTGKKLGSSKTYEELGDISIDYGAIHNITAGDVSYLCIYGWTENPLAEFYVVENYGSYKPPGGAGFVNTIEVDGGTYSVYETTRREQPSIQGTKTFQQYFSVRSEKRSEGTVSLSEHFKAWEELGLDMSGLVYEVSLCVEGYKSSGSAHVYSHVLTIGEDVYGSSGEKPAEVETPAPTDTIEATETPAPTEAVKPTETSAPTETPAAGTPSGAETAESPSPGDGAIPDNAGDKSENHSFPWLPVSLGVAAAGVLLWVFWRGKK